MQTLCCQAEHLSQQIIARLSFLSSTTYPQMHRIMASSSSSCTSSVAFFAALTLPPLPALFLVALSGGSSSFLVCWPLVALPDRRTSSEITLAVRLERRSVAVVHETTTLEAN